MTDVRITCITLSDTNAIHEHITHVGSPQFNPKGSKWTVAQVIAAIEKNEHAFHVTDAYGNTAYVGVVDPKDGRKKFIRTYADGKWNNNLLSLPQC
ncbi:DUF3892 domain-containing protein [Salmonella enterica]|uniref:DUF3892 domain-containing protein n=1 Tax=Klebsiella pneumoniae TaxID=573 RepID=UPI00180396A5|nr:DUF3892 domain-containing protein [Klebsiella pneumoniae]EAV3686135.1 DUF3892 domain-containing protein [Salmonella enterica]HCF8179466.1 DUF3892 domain-containing protein [Klebsiella variicola]EBG6879860.1 DUF3892 domain-containing protein [Salmonella enterica]MDW1309264.1 DUF3892 domain-containing protein [Klebsiella pneumoniae]HBR1650052.1 DUF3892 domain-containing protein [Klebsiella pneumoniae]